MNRNRALRCVFGALTVVLSDVMCALVAYQYCALQWCGRYAGCSAPASIAFLLAIPFAVAIGACNLLALYFHRRVRGEKR